MVLPAAVAPYLHMPFGTRNHVGRWGSSGRVVEDGATQPPSATEEPQSFSFLPLFRRFALSTLGKDQHAKTGSMQSRPGTTFESSQYQQRTAPGGSLGFV